MSLKKTLLVIIAAIGAVGVVGGAAYVYAHVTARLQHDAAAKLSAYQEPISASGA